MEIVGRAPELAGLLCEAFICEGFAHDGELVANAKALFAVRMGFIQWRQPGSVLA